jgi:alkanesulfonate monooxygenase SsuD/methylene tetrahydromethanopterin reductase-like flavin-dependent oxidoreductase (luciferase family)
VKKIGFLSFGHWSASPYSQVRSGSDALIQSIELAEAVEDLGADGAYFRVHHFAQQLASPFPLLTAIGARTKRIEIGTAVIDMRDCPAPNDLPITMRLAEPNSPPT